MFSMFCAPASSTVSGNWEPMPPGAVQVSKESDVQVVEMHAVCPTDAFPEPYTVDANRCISYLTIENQGPIPVEFREPIGNRVFGCDDCQAICPWNKFAQFTEENDFSPRHNLDSSRLVDLFQWTEAEFLKNTEGSALRRAGYSNWLRNLAVGLGNAPSSEEIIATLKAKRDDTNDMVQEHIDWALAQQAQPNKRRKRKIKSSLDFRT